MMSEGQREREKRDIPTIGELLPNNLEVVVAHVVDFKDNDMLVLGNGFADVGEELIFVVAGLLCDLGHVNNL
jgi:hypothetical protein